MQKKLDELINLNAVKRNMNEGIDETLADLDKVDV